MRRNLWLLLIALIWFGGWWFWPHFNYYLGNYKRNNYQYEEAIKAYTSAINANRLDEAKLANAYFGRAEAKHDLAYATNAGDEALFDALQDYAAAIGLNPEEPFYYRQRGTVYAYLGAYPEAFADFERMRPFEYDKPVWSLVRKGGLQKRLGDYEGALKSLQTVIDIWRPEPLMPPNYHMALTYSRMGEFELAISALDEGMKAQPDYGSAYRVRGCAKAKLGRFQEGLDDFQRGYDIIIEYYDESGPLYPSGEHNIRNLKDTLQFLKDLSSGRAEPNADRLRELCNGNWWSMYFDKARDRSPLL